MKKSRVLLLCLVLVLAVAGIAACSGGAADEYTVTFETAGGGTVNPQTVKKGETAVKPDDPVRVGFVFDGWYLGSDEYDFGAQVTENITITARYTSILGGEGTASSPFTIDTADELTLLAGYISQGAAEFINGNFVQTADITSALTAPLASFAGTYDGGGKTLNTSYAFINALSGSVKNLTVDGTVSVTGSANAGLLAVAAEGANITSVTAKGEVTAAAGSAGGIVGVLTGGRMEYCVSEATVGGRTAGGIAGESSGAVLNSLSYAVINGTRNGGGIAGMLHSGALVQNCGFDSGDDYTVNNVTAGDAAGGIAGIKEAGSAIYRGFVFGEGSIYGGKAGVIAGKADTDLRYFDDVLDCRYNGSIWVESTGDDVRTTTFAGERGSRYDPFASLDLPEGIWDNDGTEPTLKETYTLPASVTVTLDEEDSTLNYGSHLSGEYFNENNLHFPELAEIDGSVALQKIVAPETEFTGKFKDGYAEIEFTDGGASYKPSGAAGAVTLTYTGSRVNFNSFFDYFEYENVNYSAPYVFYTDGTYNYALSVELEDPETMRLMGSLVMYSDASGAWEQVQQWAPSSDAFVGSYCMDSYGDKYYLTVDGNYSVVTVQDENEEDFDLGYYLTRFEAKSEEEGDSMVLSRGTATMYYGDSFTFDAATFSVFDYSSAFIYLIYDDGEDPTADVVYLTEGDVESAFLYGTYEPDATFMTGSWFDGTNVYVIDGESGTVKIGSQAPVNFTATDKGIKFTYNSTEYNVALGLNNHGEYKLYSLNNSVNFDAAAYVENFFDGAWITDDMSVIGVTSDPAASVTFDDEPAEGVRNAVYNGALAIRFTYGGAEYYLVKYSDNVAELYRNDVSEGYAVSAAAVNNFANTYNTVNNGVVKTLTVEGISATLTVGSDAPATYTALPAYNEGLGAIVLYLLNTDNESDMKAVAFIDNDALLFIDIATETSEIYATQSALSKLTVSDYTKGTGMLQITSEGKFAVYNRGTTPAEGDYTALSLNYYDRYGLVLEGTDAADNSTYFFAESIGNINKYKIVDDEIEVLAIYVPDDIYQAAVGNYIYYNGYGDDGRDVITVHADGTVTEAYTDAKGEQHNDTLVFLPTLLYSPEIEDIGLVFQIDAGGLTAYAYADPFGLNFFSGMVPYYREALYGFTNDVYNDGNNNALRFVNGRVKVGNDDYRIGAVTENAGSVTLSLIGITRNSSGFFERNGKTATVTFTVDNGVNKASFIAGSAAAVNYTGEAKESISALLGAYADSNDVLYLIKTGLSLSGGESYIISYSDGTETHSYAFSNDVLFNTNGNQVFAMEDEDDNVKYLRKDTNGIVISGKLDESDAVTAPLLDFDLATLNGVKFVPTTWAYRVAFEYTKNAIGGGSTLWMYFTDKDGNTLPYGDDEEYEFWVEEVYFKDGVLIFMIESDYTFDTVYARVTLNEAGEVVRMTIGTSESDTANDIVVTNTKYAPPAPPTPPPAPPAPSLV